MKKITKAEDIDQMSERIRNVHNGTAVTKETFDALRKLFRTMSILKPIGEDGLREFYLELPTGKPDAFDSNFDEEDDYKYYVESFHEAYSQPTKWYRFMIRRNDVPPRNGKLGENWYVLQCGEGEGILATTQKLISGYGMDLTGEVGFLTEQVEKMLDKVKDGSYQDYVDSRIPYDVRTGRIQRKELWNIVPNERTEYHREVGEKTIWKFLKFKDEEPQPVRTITAGDFYRACYLCYKVNQGHVLESDFRNADTYSPKDAYYRFADGRDNGLKNIPEDDPDAFSYWLDHNSDFNYPGWNGNHPWEIAAGGNSTHISLYVTGHKDEGYYFEIAGSSYTRSAETIRFFVAMREAGYPVKLLDHSIHQGRLTETDWIAVDPEHVLYGAYPENVAGIECRDHLHLYNYEDVRKRIVEKTVWEPIKKNWTRWRAFSKRIRIESGNKFINIFTDAEMEDYQKKYPISEYIRIYCDYDRIRKYVQQC